MFERVVRDLEKNGNRARIVSIERLGDLEKIVKEVRDGEFRSDAINRITRDFLRFELPELPFEARSVIVVASPSPIVTLSFNRSGKRASFTVPPGYVDSKSRPKSIEEGLNRLLNPEGFHAKSTFRLPMKLLAATSGLSTYGRNNVTYVEGMGSMILISAYLSDLPCPEEPLHELRTTPLCERCRSCLNHCPTGAIAGDRYLVRAERCLTWHNELARPGEPFPDWIDPSWHNCVYGCLHCQAHCPQNRPYIDDIVDFLEYDERETYLLLENVPLESLPPATAEKVRKMSLDSVLHLFSRNVKALFDPRD